MFQLLYPRHKLKRLLVFLIIAVPLLAQTDRKKLPDELKHPVAVPIGAYCGGGLDQIPETKIEQIARYFLGDSRKKGIVHVNFIRPCTSSNPGAKTVTWMWVLNIRDITNENDTVSNLKTLNESATGMDIEGIRGHTIEWRVATR